MSSGAPETGPEGEGPVDTGTPGPGEHTMTRTAWGIGAFVVAVMLVFAGTAYSVVWSQQHSHDADLRWCQVLVLLTGAREQPPADPAKNPSRVAQYKLYEDFVTLKDEFGCG